MSQPCASGREIYAPHGSPYVSDTIFCIRRFLYLCIAKICRPTGDYPDVSHITHPSQHTTNHSNNEKSNNRTLERQNTQFQNFKIISLITLQGNVTVLVALPSGSIFTSSFNAGAPADNADWIITPYPPSMMLFTLKPGVSIPAGGTKTITIRYTAVGAAGQTGRTTGNLIKRSGGDVDKNNNNTTGIFSIN